MSKTYIGLMCGLIHTLVVICINVDCDHNLDQIDPDQSSLQGCSKTASEQIIDNYYLIT